MHREPGKPSNKFISNDQSQNVKNGMMEKKWDKKHCFGSNERARIDGKKGEIGNNKNEINEYV